MDNESVEDFCLCKVKFTRYIVSEPLTENMDKIRQIGHINDSKWFPTAVLLNWLISVAFHRASQKKSMCSHLKKNRLILSMGSVLFNVGMFWALLLMTAISDHGEFEN